MNVLLELVIVALMVHATTLLEDLTVCVTKDTLEVEQYALVLKYNLYTNFQYSNVIMSDIDECASSTTNKCDSDSTCTNTPGSFTCTCNQGYTGNGTICVSKQYSYYSIVDALYMYGITKICGKSLYMNDCNSVYAWVLYNFDEYPLLVAPSSPAMLSTTPQSTSITITWSQSPGDTVDSYQILYLFRVRVCSAYLSNPRIILVAGSSREYTLTGLEENSDFTINITAMNGAGSSPPVTTTARTAIAGRIHPS